MTVLNIYKLEDSEENNVVSSLKEGEHIIGRGDLLNCHDKKVSRRHAVIRVKEVGASITAVHVNPCFYRPCGGSIRVLPLNETVSLSDNDQFALLPTTFWFKIKLVNEHNGLSKKMSAEFENVDQDALNENAVSSTTAQENLITKSIDGDIEITLNKRSHEDDGDDEANKKFKASSSEQNAARASRSRSTSLERLLNESLNDSYCNAVTQEVSDIPESNVQVKHETVSDNENEGTEHNISVKEEPSAQSEIKQEPSTNSGETSTSAINNGNNGSGQITNDGNQNNPTSTSTVDNPTPNIRRDRCWYGTTCYRRNPQHRADFSHPGDLDYDSDPSDDRPVCPFGTACYRTNFAHRRQYKHSGKPAQKPTGQVTKKRKPKRKKKDDNVNDDENSSDDKSDGNDSGQVGTTGRQKRKVAQKKKKYTDTPEDDYDYDDPFIDDASSDEFEISSDDADDDSDWVDSQEVDEKDTKRLLKEAKQFTKGKGKKKDK